MSEYTGFRLPVGDFQLARVRAKDVSSRTFFEKFVKTRTPCVIVEDPLVAVLQGQCAEAKLLASCGEAVVRVEQKSGEGKQSYGRGEQKFMKFAEFMQALQSEEHPYYLTTQPLTAEHPLISTLEPPEPSCLSTLVSWQKNLWLGSGTEGKQTHSGLHHDFHDNLYVLLQGQKHFTLMDPSVIAQLPMYGQLQSQYSNGVCVYQKDPFLNADGTDAEQVAQESMKRMEDLLVRAEEAGVGVEEAELAADRAMQQLLDVHGRVDGNWDDAADDDDDDMEKEQKEQEEQEEAGFPDHFCRVTAEDASIAAVRRITVTLVAGEMLYLPSCWMHQVASTVAPDATSNVHMAFNYWFYPPDQFDKGFTQPYASSYLQNTYGSHEQTMAKKTNKRKKMNTPRPKADKKYKQRKITCEADLQRYVDVVQGGNHFPGVAEARHPCVYCRSQGDRVKKTKYICKACSVHSPMYLHPECMEPFHNLTRAFTQ